VISLIVAAAHFALKMRQSMWNQRRTTQALNHFDTRKPIAFESREMV